MGVTVTTCYTYFDRLDTVPRDHWKEVVVEKLRKVKEIAGEDVEMVIGWIDDIAAHSAWEACGKSNIDELLDRYAKVPLATLEEYRQGVEILRQRGHKGPIRSEEAAKARVDGENIRQGTRTDLETSLHGNEVRQGNSKEYWLRRLARMDKSDGTDFIDRYEAGEFPSVRAAAKEAGIVRDKTELEQLQHWWEKAGPGMRAAFLNWLQDTHGYTLQEQ